MLRQCDSCQEVFKVPYRVQDAMEFDQATKDAEILCSERCLILWTDRMALNGYYEECHPTVPGVRMFRCKCMNDKQPTRWGLSGEK